MYVPPDTRQKPMNLYLLNQSENDDYDTYDSCVVAAPDEATARAVSPSGWGFTGKDWADSPDAVVATLIGAAVPGIAAGTILISSFNAG